MIDLNDLRIFERVAALRSFSAASRVLELPKSSVSRSVTRLEAALAARLLQRTTREVVLTPAGETLLKRFAPLLSELDQAIDYVSGLADEPRGSLRVAAATGFGVNVLAELIPCFLQRHPHVDVVVSLSSMPVDLINSRIDVAIRIGPLPDMGLTVRRLGSLNRTLCATPGYLARRGAPCEPHDLSRHDLVELLAPVEKPASLTLQRNGEVVELRQKARVSTDCALNLYHLVLNGAGIGPCPGHRSDQEIAAGQLVRVLPGWSLPMLPVNVIFPSRRQLAPAVRAFVDFMVEHCREQGWQADAGWQRPQVTGRRDAPA